jgi:hypothetical protein
MRRKPAAEAGSRENHDRYQKAQQSGNKSSSESHIYTEQSKQGCRNIDSHQHILIGNEHK